MGNPFNRDEKQALQQKREAQKQQMKDALEQQIAERKKAKVEEKKRLQEGDETKHVKAPSSEISNKKLLMEAQTVNMNERAVTPNEVITATSNNAFKPSQLAEAVEEPKEVTEFGKPSEQPIKKEDDERWEVLKSQIEVHIYYD